MKPRRIVLWKSEKEAAHLFPIPKQVVAMVLKAFKLQLQMIEMQTIHSLRGIVQRMFATTSSPGTTPLTVIRKAFILHNCFLFAESGAVIVG